ncbi:hypothetical protein I4U23_023068 [Adineta vaga]|nr:hypothetical protein I4U23_023068 [Adineta vaga]
MRDLSREVGSFIFLQLVKQVIKQMLIKNDSTEESKQEMIDKCRLYYRRNPNELKKIDEFEKYYTPDQAIKWYTRDSFIYKLVNKALRTEDIDALYTYRFYIVDLCTCLAENCRILRELSSHVRVFRGMKMSKGGLQQFQESIGHHIFVNGYFSTSRQRSVAEIYAGIKEQNHLASTSNILEPVIFVIDMDLDAYPDIVLADVRHLSSFNDEEEVLFDLGTVFEMKSFDYDAENCYWICHMKASDKGGVIAKEYLDFKQAELNKSVDIEIVFSDLLHDMGEWLKSIAYFQRLVLRRTHDPQLHLGIARSYDSLNRTDLALSHLKQAYSLAMETNNQWRSLAAKICHYTCRVCYSCNNFVDALDYNKKELGL